MNGAGYRLKASFIIKVHLGIFLAQVYLNNLKDTVMIIIILKLAVLLGVILLPLVPQKRKAV